ncbi:MAG TPA: PPE domain-containing protein [Pseudonocardiaceae bacterium]
MSSPYPSVCTANDTAGNLWEQFNVNVHGDGPLQETAQTLSEIGNTHTNDAVDLGRIVQAVQASYTGQAAEQMNAAFQPVIQAIAEGADVAAKASDVLVVQAANYSSAKSAIQPYPQVPSEPPYEHFVPWDTSYDKAVKANSAADSTNQAVYKSYVGSTQPNTVPAFDTGALPAASSGSSSGSGTSSVGSVGVGSSSGGYYGGGSGGGYSAAPSAGGSSYSPGGSGSGGAPVAGAPNSGGTSGGSSNYGGTNTSGYDGGVGTANPYTSGGSSYGTGNTGGYGTTGGLGGAGGGLAGRFGGGGYGGSAGGYGSGGYGSGGGSGSSAGTRGPGATSGIRATEEGGLGRSGMSSASAAKSGSGMSGGPMGGGARGRGEDDDEHSSPSYLVSEENGNEIVGDLPPTAPPVIGG